MKKKTTQIIVFVILVVGLDFFIGAGLKKLYNIQKVGAAGQLNYTFFKTNQDIIILGNSRAHHHYNEKLISDSIGKTCFNAGIDGGYPIWLSYASIEAILKRYTPKLFIIEFNPASMGYWKEGQDKLSILLPYKNEIQVCGSLAARRGKYERLKWISAIYPYNSIAYSLLIGKIFEKKLKYVNGYIPISNRIINTSLDTAALFNHYTDSVDSLNFDALNNILKICQEYKVDLLFINSPIFAGKSTRLINQTTAAKLSLKMIKNAGFQYLDFSEDQRIVYNPKFFADQLHLNQTGADYFTSLVKERLTVNNKLNFGRK